MIRIALTLLVLVLSLGALGWAQDLPYPPGRSDHQMEGLAVTLHLPRKMSADAPASLVVLLHGNGGSGQNLSHVLSAWVAEGYAICAPSSKGIGWEASDLKAALKIAKRLLHELPLDKKKVHVMGFSNGGWNLPFLAFNDELRPRSAVFVGAGFRGGRVPKWALKTLGVLAVAGADDSNSAAARATVPAVRGKVRHAEFRLQPGLGHRWPRLLNPYMLWWMGVQEGRYTPGKDLNFAWGSEYDEALESLKGRKRGGLFVYLYDPDEKNPKAGRRLQNETFMDWRVRFYGKQNPALKMSRKEFDRPELSKIKKFPAVVIYSRKGKLKKILQGKIKRSRLLKALRGIAPKKQLPKS